jgi:hypothetical protein
MTNFFIFLGVMIIILVIAYVKHKKTSQQRQSKPSSNDFNKEQQRNESYVEKEQVKKPPSKQNAQDDYLKQEERKRYLNTLLESLKSLSKNQIWGLEDIRNNVAEYLSDTDVQHLAKQIPTSIFSATVWDIYDKTQNQQLSSDQISKILELGTPDVVSYFMNAYSKSTTWHMSSSLLDTLITKNTLVIFSFKSYSKSDLETIIKRLSVYELLGYRMKPKQHDETYDDSFKDLQKSTDDEDVEIEYYESIDNDIIHYLEQNYPNESGVRKMAFDKIISESANIIAMIQRVNDFSNDEISAIMKRNYQEEIDELFSSFDNSTIVNSFDALFAVKVILQLIEYDHLEEIESNYDFKNVPIDTYKEIINTLSAKELLGYDDDDRSVDLDIITLFENKDIDDASLRKMAFDKIMDSSYFSEAIARWETVTEDEIKVIMERNKDEEVNALLGRENSEDIIANLPEEVAIKILLGLMYDDAADEVENNYTFGDADVFKSIINELSADDLLGKGEFDIIKIIEDCMDDNEELRKLAFAKICEADDISNEIGNWGSVTEDEIKVIMERNKDEEVEVLLAREDSDEIILNLPEEVAIKIVLGLLYDDAADSVKDSYTFDDTDVFKKVISELSADDLLGKGELDIIKIIEDCMDDNEELRKLAFAKICEADDISREIAIWGSVTEDETKVIMERNKDEEVEALLAREDSDEIILNLPEEVAIKILLGLMYDDAADEVKDNYSFSDTDVFKKVISELSADDLLGKGEFNIIEIIENQMSDDQDLRKLAFAKICEADDISNEIAKWYNVTEEEIKVIMERNKDDEVEALLARDDSEDIMTNMPDSYIIKKYLLDDEEYINDEFDNRIDDDDFKNKVEKAAKKFSLVKLREKDKEAAVEDVSDEFIIKAKLYAIDLDECEFDIDEVKDEYLSRIDNEDFKNKVEKLIELFI